MRIVTGTDSWAYPDTCPRDYIDMKSLFFLHDLLPIDDVDTI